MIKQSCKRLKSLTFTSPGTLPAVSSGRDLHNIITACGVSAPRSAMDIPFISAQRYLKKYTGTLYKYENLDVRVLKNVGLNPNKNDEELMQLPNRNPVITLMGHVNHGKTTLLDSWRDSESPIKITETEHGKITQSIRSYKLKSGTTVVDTPGHLVFDEMREQGGFVSDSTIIVIDITQGICEQTVEAIDHVLYYDRPVVFAVTKIDLISGSDLRESLKSIATQIRETPEFADAKVATQLPELVEKNDVFIVPVAAPHKINNDLLMKIAVKCAGMCKFDPAEPTVAVLLDCQYSNTQITEKTASQLEDDAFYRKRKTEFSTTKDFYLSRDVIRNPQNADRTLLCIVKSGMVTPGQGFVVGRSGFGIIKKIEDEFGEHLSSATPGTPCQITGLNLTCDPPDSGDHIIVVSSEEKAKAIIDQRDSITRYLNDGGYAKLLTDEGDEDAFSWLRLVEDEGPSSMWKRKKKRKRQEKTAAKADMNSFTTEELIERGMVCDTYEATGICKRAACNKKHPRDIHIQQPEKIFLIIKTDTAASLISITKVLDHLNSNRVVFLCINSGVGDLSNDDFDRAAINGDFSASIVCYRIRCPEYIIPAAVSQKTNLFEFSVLSDLVSMLYSLYTSSVSDWEQKQRTRLQKYNREETDEFDPVEVSDYVKQLLSEERHSAVLCDIYNTSDK